MKKAVGTNTMLSRSLLCMLASVFAATVTQARLIVTNGYFWDTEQAEYWIPHGFAYQTINPPVYANQSPAQIAYDFLEMRKLRANSLRVDFTWGYTEPTNDVFNPDSEVEVWFLIS